MTHTIEYRPDVDGLRAIAVVSVILFHIGIPGFLGGYVGVDVFFVISGFLITSLILKELDAGTFCFKDFWVRRIRRILPALFVVMAVSSVVFAFVLTPEHYKNFGQSLVAQSFFSSNFLFWKESGYFDVSADTKPLLHTWSLAIEEQFYLLFPVLLFLLTKYLKGARLLIITLLVATSFCCSIWMSVHLPKAGFFLLPSRAWELGLGTILAFATTYKSHLLSSDLLNNVIGILGIFAIIVAVVLYDNNTPFPSYMALLPCMGAIALIWSGRDGKTFVARLLSLRFVVFVGLLSYSLYLWHWVALVFNRTIQLELPSIYSNIGAVLISAVLAYISYKYIETPFRRNKDKFSARVLVKYTVVGFGALIIFGSAIHFKGGVEERLDQKILSAYKDARFKPNRVRSCINRFDISQNPSDFFCTSSEGNSVDFNPDIVIWGDSHSIAYLPVFDLLSEETGRSFAFAAHAGCPPVPNIHRIDLPERHKPCPLFNKAVMDYILEHKPKKVIQVFRYDHYFSERNNYEKRDKRNPILTSGVLNATFDPARSFALFEKEFPRMLGTLTREGIKLDVVTQAPNMGVHVPEYLLKASILRQPIDYKISKQDFTERVQKFEEFLKRHDVHVIDIKDKFCDEFFCYAFQESKALYKDDDHLSHFGAMNLQQLLESTFMNIEQ